MATIKPFRGIRPPQNLVEQVASRPYDVLNSAEAREEAAGNEKSLYHIIKPEIDFPIGTDEHDERVYQKAAENFRMFQDKGWLVQDDKENYYVYAQTMNGKTQYKFIQILDRFEIKDNFGTKKRTKRNYNVHLSKDLMNTLLTEYNLLELKDYRNLPNRKGYRKFYLNLAKMIYLIKYKIDQGQAPYFTVTVDQLAKEFDVTVKDNHDRKKKVTSILNGINKKLERTKFQYQYIKGKGEKWPYTVQFFFDQETLEYFDEKIKAILTSQYHDALKSCFLLNKKGIPVSRHYQYKDFFKLGTGEYYHEFTAWLYSEEDKEIKENIYRDIYIKVVGIRPEDLAVNLNP